MRDYTTIELAVDVIQHAVEYGFDTRDTEGYEFFASQGSHRWGNPDDLPNHLYLYYRSQVVQLAVTALDYMFYQEESE